jgi:hypothetical protein
VPQFAANLVFLLHDVDLLARYLGGVFAVRST